MIGYQCANALPGVHHVFSQMVKVEEVNEEAIVTSFVRKTLPIIRYRTGDRIKFLEEECSCGSADPRFKLLGRIDQQVQVWSARFTLEEVDNFFAKKQANFNDYQIVIDENKNVETVKLYVSGGEDDIVKLQELKLELYENLVDVKETVAKEYFDRYFLMQKTSDSLFQRNPRTGKLSKIVDRRFQ